MVLKTGYCDLGFAKVDVDRKKRRGFPEAVFCLGKTDEQIKHIALELLKAQHDLLLTKLEKKTFTYLKKTIRRLEYHSLAKIGSLRFKQQAPLKGLVVVVSAGTSDIPVAEEASVTLETMGSRVHKLYDVGVAGVHRLLQNKHLFQEARVIIVVAGMEGALGSLVSGLVSCPVIAVPTSVGYGAHFGGLSALLTMLNGCSPGVGVVNIDNGFGAGYLAALINLKS